MHVSCYAAADDCDDKKAIFEVCQAKLTARSCEYARLVVIPLPRKAPACRDALLISPARPILFLVKYLRLRSPPPPRPPNPPAPSLS